ncbi:MAG: site-specific integrase [Deltaproteobacteria bacterium]|nr:site-specific integrase [Deltaproteobacteria bacterium]
MATRERTKYPGVYQRESADRLFKGKTDICFDVTFKFEGKKVWEKIGWLSEGYTAKLASDIRAERMRSMRHGEELPREKKKAPRLSDVWAKYEAWARANKARGGRDDTYLYNNHLKDRFSDKRLDGVSPFDLERMKNDLLKNDYSPATVKHCLVLIRQIYNKSMAWGLYQGGNPVRGVKMPTLQNQRTRFLSHEEASELLERLKAMRTLDLHDMALLSLYTGLRAGEIFNLRGYDLDFQNDIIRITDPKNKTTRHAYMTGTIKDMLQSRTPENPADFVFRDTNGKKIVSISHSFRRIIGELGFNDGITDRRQAVTFHSLRHTFASWLAIQGESIITLKDMLGHKSTAMAERYAHLVPDHKRRAAVRLEATFNGKAEVEVVK